MSDCPRKYERYEQLCNKCQDYEWCQICDDWFGGYDLSEITIRQDGRYLCDSCVDEIEEEETNSVSSSFFILFFCLFFDCK